MRKLFAIFFITFMGFLGAYSQVSMSTSAYVKGYWTDWKGSYYRVTLQYTKTDASFTGMEIRLLDKQPWDWCFKFEIDNYKKVGKEIRRIHMKNNSWYEYSGWVEYYVCDDYPTIQKVLERYQFPHIQPTGDSARAKRRARATIKIAPYENVPKCYNIYFDNIGVGLSFSASLFDKSYFVL